MSSPYTNLKIEKTPVYELIQQAQDLSFVKNVDVIDKNNLLNEVLVVDKVKIAISIKNLLENNLLRRNYLPCCTDLG